MKEDPSKDAVQRLQALIVRETGAPVGPSVEAEMASIVQSACSAAGERITGADAERAFVEREVTILLADLRGFTAITATLPAGAVITMLNRCLGRMNEIVSRYQGVIDKFMGDSVMVLFGVPLKQPDDVNRALACAIEMQLAMLEINNQDRQDGIPDLSMGIGINTGNVTAGKIGSDFYSEYTVIGDEVNLTSRIEAFSLRGQILISESTYDRCRDFITVSQAMEVFVKGKSQSVRLRELYAIPSLNLEVPQKDSRHSQRLEVRLPCSFRLIQNKMVIPRTYSATIRDIGYFGLLLEIDHPLKVYDDVKLEFDLPLVEYKASDIYGKVVELEHDKSGHLAGIEFTSISHETNMKLQLYVQLLVMASE
ncbi:MAG TPA: adenylate/guanylate cyclase domain-containing protein [Gallionella sp.]|nr:adenylate/guanylate cyclase domain-containing protein [Gallionella sp.]